MKLGAYGLLRFNLPLFPEATLDFVPCWHPGRGGGDLRGGGGDRAAGV